ncbi:hypothetical protein F4861DRAFT_277010 [Xylaria intraflava]|nr:hypothetical protein F4861DRAFT_277010 [Xylaria intraflava]
MTVTKTKGGSHNDCHDSRQEADKHLIRLLGDIGGDLERNALGSYSEAYEAMYKATMRHGIESLIGTVSIPKSQAWADAMDYGREVIVAPDDSPRRASSPWVRSCSELHKELLTWFGPETKRAAQLGTASIISDHYNGNRLAIAHVDKKASFLRHCHDAHIGAAFYPPSNLLAANCYQTASLGCSLAMSSFLPVEKAVQAAYISHLSVCDDLGSITREELDVRIRMVAISAGVAYQYGGKVLNVFVDGTAKQATGTGNGKPRPIEAAMAWRAIGGCSTIYSEYNFGSCSLEQGLVAPIVMMAAHDLFDWRCDVAAGNYENSVSATYGFGIADPFHEFLETMLKYALIHPRSGIYGIAAVVFIQFTAGRYGCWEYHGANRPACEDCINLLSKATAEAGLRWAPKSPPESYAAGNEAREWGRLWSDHFIDRSLIQETTGWFQFLVSSGKIWNFDVLAEGVQAVDSDADWA